MKTKTLLNVALRSLFLEASWNYQGQQNLGLAASIDPALIEIYGTGEKLQEARQRSLEFFNTNPITSGIVIGVIINLEQELACGKLAADKRVRMVTNLSQGLASMGDALFWQAFLPLCSLMAVWAFFAFEYWFLPLLLPLFFCLPTLLLRFFGLFIGYDRGIDVIDLLSKLKLLRLALYIRRAVALLVGASTVIVVFTKTGLSATGSISYLWLSMAAVISTVLCFRFLSLRVRPIGHWYPVLIVTLACIILLLMDKFVI